jgi:hypothetical protein
MNAADPDLITVTTASSSATGFTVTIAADRLHVSARRVHQLIKDGRLAATLTPLGYLIDPQALSSQQLADRRPGRPRKQPAH